MQYIFSLISYSLLLQTSPPPSLRITKNYAGYNKTTPRYQSHVRERGSKVIDVTHYKGSMSTKKYCSSWIPHGHQLQMSRREK